MHFADTDLFPAVLGFKYNQPKDTYKRYNNSQYTEHRNQATQVLFLMIQLVKYLVIKLDIIRIRRVYICHRITDMGNSTAYICSGFQADIGNSHRKRYITCHKSNIILSATE